MRTSADLARLGEAVVTLHHPAPATDMQLDSCALRAVGAPDSCRSSR